ncbi:hypothetical protein NDU88_005301 [Pleurodeles waltl]|uniref:Uncharacterized protein n=1 Tax=Pleurodeles waltl TaxID=8319 RepID=A0AAV7X0A0_PLEWA|nr:hypothetical protein NDU88_005301 [Pleurodeles waltl]
MVHGPPLEAVLTKLQRSGMRSAPEMGSTRVTTALAGAVGEGHFNSRLGLSLLPEHPIVQRGADWGSRRGKGAAEGGPEVPGPLNPDRQDGKLETGLDLAGSVEAASPHEI